MTDLPEYDGVYDATALIEIVAPGNVEEGINYSISLGTLGAYILAALTDPTIITSGATLGAPYEVLTTDVRVLVNKTVASASYIDLGAATARVLSPVMIRDLKGDAATNNITVTFTGTCDGLASPIVIDAAYGGWVFNPLADGNWYLTNT